MPMETPMDENVRDQVVPVLGLFETPKGHLGAGNVFLGVLEVFKLQTISTSLVALNVAAYQCILLPLNPFGLICIGI